MHEGKIVRLFTGAHTPDGFRSFGGEALRDMERVFIIEGAPGCGQGAIIGLAARSMAERGYDVEVWPGTISADMPAGVVIPRLGAAVIDGTMLQGDEPQYPGVRDEIIDLGEYWNRRQLRRHAAEIRALTDDVAAGLRRVYARMAECDAVRRGRDDAAAAITEGELQNICRALAEEIFGGQHLQVRRFFSGAVGMDGWQSTAQELSAVCRRRWLIYGASADSVAAALEEMQRQAVNRGHNVDLYYSCWRPDKLDMVVLPGISSALVDSSLPDLEPRPDDRLIKLNELPEETLAAEDDWEECWQQQLDAAVAETEAAYQVYERLAGYYRSAIDAERLEGAARALLEELWSMAAEREQE